MGSVDLSSLLAPNFLPQNLGRAGPELSACQMLVAAFVDAQKILNSNIHGLQEEIIAHKEHIGRLKKELNAACTREYDEEVLGAKILNPVHLKFMNVNWFESQLFHFEVLS